MTHADGDEAAGTAQEQQRWQQQQQLAAVQMEFEEEFDPWAPLDMHDPGTMARKPFRRAKRLPKFKRALPPAASGSVCVPEAVPGRLVGTLLAHLREMVLSSIHSPRSCNDVWRVFVPHDCSIATHA